MSDSSPIFQGLTDTSQLFDMCARARDAARRFAAEQMIKYVSIGDNILSSDGSTVYFINDFDAQNDLGVFLRSYATDYLFLKRLTVELRVEVLDAAWLAYVSVVLHARDVRRAIEGRAAGRADSDTNEMRLAVWLARTFAAKSCSTEHMGATLHIAEELVRARTAEHGVIPTPDEIARLADDAVQAYLGQS